MTPTHPPIHVELSEADVRRYVVEANRTARILGTLLPLAMLVVGAPIARGMLTAVTDVAALRQALEPWREHVTGEAA